MEPDVIIDEMMAKVKSHLQNHKAARPPPKIAAAPTGFRDGFMVCFEVRVQI